MTNVRSTTKDFYALIKSAWTPANRSSKGSKFSMKRSKPKPSKAYLERSKKLDEKWAAKKPSLDELIADLEWLVQIEL